MKRVAIILAAVLATSNSPRAVAAPAVEANVETTVDAETTSLLGDAVSTRMIVGATVKAGRGPAGNIRIQVAVPLECAEQSVQLGPEDVSPQVGQLEYRLLPGGGARQMLIHIPELPAGQTAKVEATFDVVTRTIVPPENVEELTAPKKIDRKLKPFLSRSPFIEVGDRKIREAINQALEDREQALREEATGEDEATDDASEKSEETKSAATSDEENLSDEVAPPTDWERVEAFYDYAREKVKYQEGDDQSAVQSLKLGSGDCQGIGALFVAMCRTAKVPARLVWADGHVYAEFYLERPDGVGHWYPVETAGSRAFGEMPTARVILQKGDNFHVPERREALRYATDFAAFLARPGQQPSVTYVRRAE